MPDSVTTEACFMSNQGLLLLLCIFKCTSFINHFMYTTVVGQSVCTMADLCNILYVDIYIYIFCRYFIHACFTLHVSTSTALHIASEIPPCNIAILPLFYSTLRLRVLSFTSWHYSNHVSEHTFISTNDLSVYQQELTICDCIHMAYMRYSHPKLASLFLLYWNSVIFVSFLFAVPILRMLRILNWKKK